MIDDGTADTIQSGLGTDCNLDSSWSAIMGLDAGTITGVRSDMITPFTVARV